MPDNSPLVLEIANTVLFVASLGVCDILNWRCHSARPIIPFERRRPVPWQGVDLAFVFLAFLFLGGAAFKALGKSDEPDRPALGSKQPAAAKEADRTKDATDKDQARFEPRSRSELIAEIAVRLVTGAVAIGWVVYRVRATSSDLGISSSKWGSDLRRGGLTFIAAYFPVMAVEALLEHFVPYEHPLIESVKSRPDVSTLVLTGISAVVVAPLFEEFLFRVLIQGCFEAVEAKRRWLLAARWSPRPIASTTQTAGTPAEPGTESSAERSVTAPRRLAPTEAELTAMGGPAAWPIVATSALFALMHLGQGAAPIPLFIFSLFLGYVYQRTHRIWPSLVAHMLLNGTSMAALWYLLMNPVK